MTRRLVLSFLALTVVVLLVLEVPLGISAAQRERDRLTLDLERDARAIGSFAEDTLEGIASEDLSTAAERYDEQTGARVVIVDAQGRLVADTQPLEGAADYASRPEIAAALEGEVATGTRHSDSLDADLLYVAVPVASGGDVHGVVRLTYPTTEVDRRVRDTWLTLAAVAGISLLAASLIGVALARWIAAPLRRVQEGATALGDGDLATRVPERSGPPEVRALAAAFNETARRLEELIEAQDAFVADASHQLRTPLTALRLRLENLESEGGDDRADVLAALDEVRRLARMVDGLLALARAERHAAGSLAVPVAVTAALDERRDAWAPVGDERAVTIAVEGAADLSVLVEPGRFAQVVDNLLDNALEASPPGTTVVLRAVEDGDRVEVHVEDQGPGMTDEQRARAFDRFWQGAEGTGSSGLGLAIVSKLVHADSGAVDLRPAASGGLDAVVVLPRAPA